MKLTSLSFAEGKAAASAMPFAWIRYYSDLYIGPAPERWEEGETVEARFFDGTREVRFFRSEGTLCAAMVVSQEGDPLIKRTCRIAHPRFGSRLTVTTLLQPDGDGQMNPAAVFLSGWEGNSHDP